MVDQNNMFPIGSKRSKRKSPSRSQNLDHNVIITNTMCFSTVLILLFLLSLFAYELGLINKILYLYGISGVTDSDILTYILASLIILFVIGCIISKNQKKYLDDRFGIRRIDVNEYKTKDDKHAH